ncbi:MAG: NUDIX hydrolase [Candidatus Micrarchaeota archaeon]|nr:NUDIX hydrolase [Candidatus Micrarchaeota archaeon]
MRPFACDAVILSKNRIILVRRGNPPFKGSWALPGGKIENNESAEQCLIREAKEETGLSIIPLKLIGVYSNPKRDPRRTITCSFLAKISSGKLKSGSDADEAKWFPVSKLPKLAFDHNIIIRDALNIVKEL